MKRSEMREHIFRMLFGYEFHSMEELEEQAQLYLEDKEQLKDKEKGLIRERFLAVAKETPNLDAQIETVSTGWKLSRMGKVELAVIRLASYEILCDPDIPEGVAINEAVELAKRYGEDSSSRFVNGILAKLVEEKQ